MRSISCLGLLLISFKFTLGAQAVSCLRGDCDNGHSRAILSNGKYYEGDFVAGLPQGLGVLAFPNGDEYYGNFHQQYQHGKGRMRFANGDEYLGDFYENTMQGNGTMHYARGDRYQGEWYAGLPHGDGVLIMASQDEYQGAFVAGMFHGDGTMYYADGRVYQGQWQYHQKHGQGVLTFSDGSSQSGWWEADQLTSEQTLATSRTSVSASPTRNCNLEYCLEGEGVFTYRNGTRYTGAFQRGIPEGEGKVTYANGDRYEGGWKNHQPQGRGTMYYQNGALLSAIWEQGQPGSILQQTSPQPARPVDVVPDQEVKIWAVIVGAAQYQHLQTLNYTDDDAYQLYAHLRSPQGGALKDQQLRLLIDEAATRTGIMQAIRQTFQQADANDVIIFYFSGHGIQNAFLPIDYDGNSNLLYHHELRQEIERSPARHKLVIGDACHAGGMAFRSSSPQEALRAYYRTFEQTNGGMALLMSSKSVEYSIEDRGLRSGVFSYFLIKGLKGAADRDNSGIVSVDEIYQYIYHNVRSYTGNAQSPQLFGYFDRRMPVSTIY